MLSAAQPVSGFQLALTHLLRTPEDARARLDGMAVELALSPDERVALQKVADDPLVLKYAQLMRMLRKDGAMKALPVAKEHLDMKVVADAYYDLFEPTAALVRQDELGAAFLDFLTTSPDAAPIYERLPLYARDLFLYERASLMILGMKIASMRLKPPSPLRHRAFLIIDLDHDLPAFLRDGTLHRRPTKLLFLRVATRESYKLFAIDDQLQAFLEGRSDDAPTATRAALVRLGLCR